MGEFSLNRYLKPFLKLPYLIHILLSHLLYGGASNAGIYSNLSLPLYFTYAVVSMFQALHLYRLPWGYHPTLCGGIVWKERRKIQVRYTSGSKLGHC